jgi:hypothetical protein
MYYNYSTALRAPVHWKEGWLTVTNLMLILGISGLLFIVFEITALQKSASALPGDFPQLSAAQFTRRQALQRHSAWWLLVSAIFGSIASSIK